MHRSCVQRAGLLSLLRDLVRWNKTNAALQPLPHANTQATAPHALASLQPPPPSSSSRYGGSSSNNSSSNNSDSTPTAAEAIRATLQLATSNHTHANDKGSRGNHTAATATTTPVTALDVVEAVVRTRHTHRKYDVTRSLDADTLTRVLAATTRAPTAYNLQPWCAIVVRDAQRRRALCTAALSQSHVRDAAAVVIFAADTELTHYAPLALEAGLQAGYVDAHYAPRYLRNVYYHLQAGPHGVLARCKNAVSSLYSARTRTPLLTVPDSMRGYAAKQAMLPATTFSLLCTAAGWQTCFVEGYDETAVKSVVQLPARFTVAVLVCVGHAATAAAGTTTTTTAATASAAAAAMTTGRTETTSTAAAAVAAALLPPPPAVRSPRFAMSQLVRYETY